MEKRSSSYFRVLKLLFFSFSILSIASCSVQKQIARSAKADVLDSKALQAAHVGISIFDPTTNKYLYDYQGDKYFVPASNTKLPTCYAAMKYLGDSLVGMRYQNGKTGLKLFPSADPTFMHPDYKNQPVFNNIRTSGRHLEFKINKKDSFESLGNGWAWNDYDEEYMPERSRMPIFGNLITVKVNPDSSVIYFPQFGTESYVRTYRSYEEVMGFSKPIARSKFGNQIFINLEKITINRIYRVPFTNHSLFPPLAGAFADTMKIIQGWLMSYYDTLKNYSDSVDKKYPILTIHSQPTDSLLKPMMHRSDNFFAEQSLLMVSNERLGVMDDEKIIDTLLKTDFKDLPQKPRWADGSGLSRYNLFTPQDFIFILNKIKNEFGMERLKVILPTGGEGTISSYYKADSGYIYGKTGTLSGVVAFSGFLYTKKGKLLIFSILVNNHRASATDVRRSIEKFIQGIREKY